MNAVQALKTAERLVASTGPSAGRDGRCYEGCGAMGSCHPNLDADARALALHVLQLETCEHIHKDGTEFSDGSVREECASCHKVWIHEPERNLERGD